MEISNKIELFYFKGTVSEFDALHLAKILQSSLKNKIGVPLSNKINYAFNFFNELSDFRNSTLINEKNILIKVTQIDYNINLTFKVLVSNLQKSGILEVLDYVNEFGEANSMDLENHNQLTNLCHNFRHLLRYTLVIKHDFVPIDKSNSEFNVLLKFGLK